MKVAQHFSAGSRALNYSKAREAGARFRTKPISVVRFADLIIETLPDPSAKVLGYSHRAGGGEGRKYLAKVPSRQTRAVISNSCPPDFYDPNRLRYSLLLRKAFTISAPTKSPLNWFSLPSQKLKPSKLRLVSGASSGFRRRYPKYCMSTKARFFSFFVSVGFSATCRTAAARPAVLPEPKAVIALLRSVAVGVTPALANSASTKAAALMFDGKRATNPGRCTQPTKNATLFASSTVCQVLLGGGVTITLRPMRWPSVINCWKMTGTGFDAEMSPNEAFAAR